MIFEILIGLLIILIIAHIIVHKLIKRKTNNKEETWNFQKEALQISQGNKNFYKNKETFKTETEIILPQSKPKNTNENEFLNYGKVIANEQKIKMLTFRIETIEKTLAQLIKKNINENDVDIEKLEFKIKVLQKEIEEIKNPKKETNTFYGRKNDPLEKEIRALAFNSKRK